MQAARTSRTRIIKVVCRRRFIASKRNSQRRLYLPVPITAECARNCSEACGTHVSVGIAEMRRVRQIVKFTPELQLESFRHSKTSEKRKVIVTQMRSTNRVPS